MEKTTTITLGGMRFSLTESAYAKLHSYLERLKAHFAHEAESKEIMRDIESRIAEKLAHKRDGVISDEDVATVIAEIGEASEIDEDEEEPRPSQGHRRLYRDMDNAWIAGVAGGLANYFDIDPLWIRLLFLISLFFGGSGILVYIILWVLIPEAKTSGQKLEMKGHPVNLEGIARVVRENVDDARRSGLSRHISHTISAVIRGVFRIVSKITGSILLVGSFAAMIALMVGTGILIVNWNAPYNDFPLRGVVSGGLLFTGAVAGFFVILIPLISFFAIGIRLVSRKVIYPSAVGLGLIGLWAVAASTAGTIAVTSAGKFYEYQQTNPDYQVETVALELAPFTKISASEGRVTIKQGPIQTVEISGRAIERENALVEVVDGTLVVREKDEFGKVCIFCNDGTAEITVTTPDLESVRIEGASVSFEEYNDAQLAIEMIHGSLRGTLSAGTLNITADGGVFRGDLTTDTLTVNAEGAHFDLDGSAREATVTLENTSWYGTGFSVESFTLTSRESVAEVNAAQLVKNNDRTSHVVNSAEDNTENEIPEENIE